MIVHVAPWGDDDNPGTLEKPLRTINLAVRQLKEHGGGGTVKLARGVYEPANWPVELESGVRLEGPGADPWAVILLPDQP